MELHKGWLVFGAAVLWLIPPVPGAVGPHPEATRTAAHFFDSAARAGVLQSEAANPNPGILPPQSHPYGRTYGEWTAEWWRWALSIPATQNPVTDTTGQFCAVGQSGPVWFLAGTFSNAVERVCAIPTGKAIFMPVFNWIFGSGVFDCEPTNPGVPCDVESLRNLASKNTEAATILDVSIDGVPVRNVRDYRASSPGPFSITYPNDSVVGVPAGTYYPQVADGYWLMLTPFSPGNHTIILHVVAPVTINGPYEFNVVYHLTVR